MSREVPEGWKSARLGALVEIERASFNIKEINSFDSVRLYSLPAFDSGAVPENAAGSEVLSNKYRVPTDCILFSKLNPRIPRVWRVRHEHQEPALGSTEFWPLRPRNGNVDLDFLTSFLTSADFLNSPEITPASSTNSHQRVDRKAFENFEMLLPPLHEQRRISEILSSVDEAIAATRAVIDQTRKVKQGVLERMLTKGIGHTRFKQTEIGEIPDGWEVVELDAITPPDRKITYGIVQAGPDYPEGIPYIRVSDMGEYQIDEGNVLRTSPEIAGKYVRSELRSGDIVFALRGKVGHVLRTPKSLAGANLTQGTARIACGDRVLSEFLLWALRSPQSERQYKREIKGSTFQELTLGSLKRIRVPLPSLEEQQLLAHRIEGVEAGLRSSERSVLSLLEAKSALMSDLLTGRKRVTDPLPMAAE